MRHLCVVAAVLALVSTAAGQSLRIDEGAARVTLNGTTYSVVLTANSTVNHQSAVIRLWVIAPSGVQVASSSLPARLKPGTNKLSASVTLPELPKKSEDLLWYRLAYSVLADGSEVVHGILPLFESVQDFALHVSAPALVQPGKKFFVRVHTSHPIVGRAVPGVAVTAQVRPHAGESALASATGLTDSNGYAVLSMFLPSSDTQGRDLEVAVQAQHGTIKKNAENDLKVGAPGRILVQTDKPLYQPAQTLHIRALIFGDEHRALGAKKVYFQVEDEDGTVVFKDERTSSRFGVVAADWTIPDRIKLGEYRILAKTYPGQYVDSDNDDSDDEDSQISAAADRRTVRISRYELPTFVVSAKPDRTYYLPEQQASLEISADYLFGKPVPKAAVRISRLQERKWNFAKQKWEIDEDKTISGITDDQGRFRATLDLSKEQADLDESSYRKFRDVTYTAYVTDPSTARTEERRFDVRVTKHPIHVYYVPQNSSRRGLPDEFFVSTSYADGSPAQCEVEVRTVAPDGSGEHVLANVQTSRYGVARVRNPKSSFAVESKELPLILVARDRKGASGITTENLSPGPEHFLRVITRKTILAPEESIEAEIRSDSDDEVIIELANQSKVLRAFTTRLRHHWAIVRIPYSSEFIGQLTLAAINMEHGGGYWDRYGISGARSVIYPQNHDLKIALHLDRSEYRPGQDAAATVQVRTAEGSTIPSVIGAVIFDEAVEERARIDEDLRDPFGFGAYGGWWYQGEAKLANLTRGDLDRVDTTEPASEDLDTAADFLLNAYSYGWGGYSPVFGDDYDSQTPGDVYKDEIQTRLQPLLAALDKERSESAILPRSRRELDALLERHHPAWSSLRDPWGSEFIPKFSVDRNNYMLDLISPGADKRDDTEDDFSVAVRAVNFYGATERQVTRALEEYHRKTGGFVRDLPALKTALSDVGIDLSRLIDPWGQPYVFEFGVNGAQFIVRAKTRGADGKPGEEYQVGTSAIDYFAESRTAIDKLLPEKIEAAGKTPGTADEFKALLLPEIHVDDLRDPYGRPYLIRTAAVARYTDRWVQNNQQVKTEPITIWNRLIKIRSVGADGIPDTVDDFDVAVFSAVQSEVTVTGNTSTPTVHMLFTGNTGGITGVITDPTGAVVANTKIVAVNANTSAEYQATTDSNGSYLLVDLPPGVYNLSVHASGFMVAQIRAIVIRAQEAVEVNATLRLGATTETVEVSAEAQLVSTSESAMASTVNKPATTDLAQQATVTPRLRQYFPETLLWQPSIETDRNGRAHINWKFADNLTTWKLSLIASTLDGRLATLDKEVKSFQPFFVEHDPPKVLTLGDRISLPVVIRNYTEKSERVKVEMPAAEWFRSNSTDTQQASVAPGGNTKLIFPFEAVATTATGKQRVIATGATVADAIERIVAVHPDGAELTRTDGRLVTGNTKWDFDVPNEAIAGSLHADLKIYPDLLAHVGEALEGMLQRPWGCGEQTISSTYPSVLLLKFEKESKRPLGPLHDRALRYVAQGYTRLLSYVDDSGGVTYWGRGEPNLALTAYAVRFLHDASRLAAVDPNVLDRARQWLFRQQKPDGSWIEHHWYASSPVEDAILTSYIAHILSATESSDPKDKNVEADKVAIRRALDNVATATSNFTDPYLFASYGLAEMAGGQPKRAEGVIAKLRAAAETERGASYWELQANTPFYGWGRAGRVETTALAVQLLDQTNDAQDRTLSNRGLEFLIEQKDRYGVWYSTQTTVNVIDALLLLASRETSGTQAPLRIAVNGTAHALSPTAPHVLGPQILDISSLAHPGNNTVEISGGNGTLGSAQTIADYYVRWNSPLAAPKSGPLKLSVTCDRTQLEVGAKGTCAVLAERIGSAGHGMMIAEIGVPPGVDVDRESLKKQISENGWDLSSFDVLPDRIVAYLWPRAGGTKFSLSFTTRMAIDAQAAPHTLFDYYNPDASVTIAPDRFTVVEP